MNYRYRRIASDMAGLFALLGIIFVVFVLVGACLGIGYALSAHILG